MKPSAARVLVGASFLVVCGLGLSHLASAGGRTTLALAGPHSAGTQVCTNAAAFPSGFDYPQQPATVEQWVFDRSQDKVRQHGWYLFAGLNAAAAGGAPVWRTWCTSTQAFATSSGASARRALASPAGMNHQATTINAKRLADGPSTGEQPINLPNPPYYQLPRQVAAKYPQCVTTIPNNPLGQQQLIDGPTFQSNGDIMVAGVIYDTAAFDWIRSQQLYLGATLTGQLPPAGQTKQMTPMPTGSIVLKPMMWPVQGTGYTALPVWDDLPPSAGNGKYIGFEVQSKWPRAVAVTAQPQSGIARVSVTYLHGVYGTNLLGRRQIGPLTYHNAQVVPTSDFYSFSFPDLETMHPCDRAILDASAYWAYGRAFARNDSLVLIAMHVLTKEQPDWTFQSVWWHDRPNQGQYAANRPNIPADKAPGPWKHYLLTATYGITQPPLPSNLLPVAYNPYIELAADHPIATNCLNCHHRAAWPNEQGGPPPQASYEAAGGPSALSVFQPNNAIFDDLLTTDSMWAIADRAHATSSGRMRRPR